MSTKKFLRSLVCVSVTIASLVMSRGVTVSAAGPICTVPGDYSTIQAAVSDPGCTTINVLAGAYTENVTISRPCLCSAARLGS